ncbi:rRNA small subunit methyltransferase B [Salinibacterium sp. NSLL150]|uniref:RsmB/NOP family class I SAM-dependent RNA methyltransferase n=1 Tax=unclassified Salinibacterium TaxID=2632331 RepID=UPI0018CD803E|nr:MULTISPECIES: transcription antitermination factor NusB [unclassified Salinibacterium]MBH0099080.1 rRNA small subunit methyltransferase B [Salinibacterium sp. NSLL35]MBH0101834.1 rRNA small subunit methyltransferase B [Salinibacterium sp. NSLL150]MBH0104594.1 rRNA small subunit methyltransferase B [Salinibacterium sp. NSLL16]MBH0107354.1 rRNA small subunit methyltransferase B [Salinibacterium sp. NSLL17]
MSYAQSARRVALDVIMAVRESDAYANLLLPVHLERAKLSSADAGLATELTYGTLRMQGYYDAVIAQAAGRDVSKIDPPVLDVLRLATHQLLSMRVPSHAAVDESVRLAKTIGSRSAVGFVNAVLRAITKHDADTWRERVIGAASSGEQALAVAYSHPLWVTRAFRQVLVAEGREAELEGLLAADNVPARVSVAALPGFSEVADIDITPAEYSPVGGTLREGDPSKNSAIAAGRARVQDEGSQIAALALSRARPIVAGESWLDMCAGPGGKAALLAAEALKGGAVLTANELIPARAKLVRNALAVFDAPPVVWEKDGIDIGEEHPEQFDRILLDAPCTGLGALRRRPEARWRKQPGDVAQLGAIQTALLQSALKALKPGGVLAYVTCSPHAAETKAIVGSVLRKAEGITKMDTPSVVQSFSKAELDLPEATHVQLWPHRHGTDAMFIQLLVKADS